MQHKHLAPAGLLERYFTPQHRTQHPAGMGIALAQPDKFLVGQVEENGDGIAAPHNGADQRQRRPLRLRRFWGGGG